MIRGEFTAMYWRKAKTMLKLSAMVANVLAFFFALSLLLYSVSPPSIVTSSSSYFADLSYSSSDPFRAMQFAKTFNVFDAAVLPSKMTASVRNVGRSTAFRTTQSLWFFYPERSAIAAQRSTSVKGI